MTKRKITQQQQRRIKAKQAEILDTDIQSGLVIAHFGQSLEIEDDNGQSIMCKKRQNLGAVVPGDRVKWQADTQNGVIVAIEPRKSLLSRPDARDNLHAVAANIDQMFIVIAPEPSPNQTTIDRYLLAAAAAGIKPVIILNKEDLLGEVNNKLLELLQIYKDLGIENMVISAKHMQHFSALDETMQHKTSVFVGQSGVGKSSILAKILPSHDIKIGAIADSIKQGKHTTTTARLYHVEQFHADIIDSPGIREFPLWKLDQKALAEGFVEFRPFLQECKFRNCQHLKEPHCAIAQAVSNGQISEERFTSYQKILTHMQQQ